MADDSIEIDVHVFVTPAWLEVRIKPADHLPELDELLAESKIEDTEGGSGAYFLHSCEVIQILVANAAAWTALAGILKVFINRHRNKKVKFNDHGKIIEIDGYSADEIKELLIASREEGLARAASLLARIADGHFPPVEQCEEIMVASDLGLPRSEAVCSDFE